MKAALFYGAKQPFKIEEVDRPELRNNQAMVKVEACNICGGDLHRISGGLKVEPVPSIIGHQVSGIITEVGTEVTDFRPGDRVAVVAFQSCGSCINCLDGMDASCLNTPWSIVFGYYGGFAEYVSAPVDALIPVPESIPLDEASSLSDAFSTPFNAVRLAKIEVGESVVIFGVGDLGSSAVQFAKLEGAYVIAVDTKENKLEMAKKLGADEVVNASKETPVEAVLGRFTEGGVDVAFEMAGTNKTTLQCLDSVRPRGRVVLVGATDSPINGFITMPFQKGFSITRGLTLIGCYAWGSTRNVKTVFKLRERNVINTSEGTTIVPLADINKGFDLKQRGVFNRVLIKP